MTRAVGPRESVSVGAELQVLLQCGRDILNGKATSPQHAISGAPDWQRTLKLARQHGLKLLFLRWCRGGSFDSFLPDEGEHSDRYDELRRQNLATTAQLVTLADRLNSAGVQCLAYKGPVVASRAYADATIRHYADIDILVAPSAHQQAKSLLKQEGYEMKQINRAVFQSVWVHPDWRFPVDLHTHVVPDFFPLELPFDELYSRRESIDVGGQSVQGVSLSDAILIHSIHGSKHHWYRLEWVVAVALLMQQHQDLPGLLGRAENLGCERMLLLAVLLSQRLFDARFETLESVLNEKSQSMQIVRAAADKVIHWLTDANWTTMNIQRTHLVDFGFRSRLMSGWFDKMRFWSAALTKPRPEDEEAIPIPEPLSPLYRIIRPFRLLYEYRGTLAKRLRG